MSDFPADSIPSGANAATNAPELTVSELSGALKRAIEDRFGHVRLRGEVSGWRGPHSSGHCYFALKDKDARIDAIIWKGVYNRLRIRPEEGMEVIATGKVTTYPGKSSYQIVIEAIEPAGMGALLAQLEERRRRLAAEGLFDAARKQLLPYMPAVIGVVTSPTGAVIRDILHRIADRFPLHVIVWPVRVQGETSGDEVAAAIAGFNALEPGGAIPRPDVLIVARGGGSLEDLWGFNDESVVRAAAASLIPLISAVGHETDWTLIDHAADVRAPTPTAAAELAVPVKTDLLAKLASLAARLAGAGTRLLERRRADLRALARSLPSGEDLLAFPRQRSDRAGERLLGLAGALVQGRRLALAHAASALSRHSPQAELARRREHFRNLDAQLHRLRPALFARPREKLVVLEARLSRAMQTRVVRARERLTLDRRLLTDLHGRLRRGQGETARRLRARFSALQQLHQSLGYKSVLARGFALVRDQARTPLRRAREIAPGAALHIEFADGEIAAVSEGAARERDTTQGKPSQDKLPARRKTRKPDGSGGQGSLF